jgi:hypothetical protein
MNHKDLPKVLYIAGYGRSGSTVLDIILGNHSEIFSTGELYNLSKYSISESFSCTCGANFRDCSFWKTVVPQIGDYDFFNLTRKLESIFYLPRLFLGLVPSEEKIKYRKYQQNLFANISTHSGKSIIVDSSQSSWPAAGRFIALNLLADLDVYVLHLIRNGLDTMQSIVIHGSNRAIEGQRVNNNFSTLRAPLGWASANLWSSLLGGLQSEGRYMMLRYEDFIRNPGKSLQSIGSFCGFDASSLIGKINQDVEFHVGHMVGGNRIRHQKEIRLYRSISEQYGRKLGWFHLLMFYILGGYLSHFYGYRLPWRQNLDESSNLEKGV